MDSPVGPLTLEASSLGLVAIRFISEPNSTSGSRRKFRLTHDPERMHPYVAELEAYFRGELREFGVPLDLRGTNFQEKCWRALLKIPYGATVSYGHIAREVGSPRGFRAVGMANHNNPIPIMVPCHRVLASDGTLCGYGGGLDIKRKLLELERRVISNE